MSSFQHPAVSHSQRPSLRTLVSASRNDNKARPKKSSRRGISSPARTLLLASLATLGIPFATRAQTTPDSPIVLNPFDVTESANRGYMATNTISGTALNTPLKEVPMTINVVTSELLGDMAVNELTQALAFTSSITQTGRQPVSNRGDIFSIRGFRNRNVLVDGVTGGDFIPPQLIDRIEIVKGPNTLYGQSDPGGLINIITKRPQGANRLGVSVRAGNHGLLGAEFDANQRVANNTLGVRVFGAHTETDGYRIVDGRETDFVGLAAEYRLGQNTTFLLHASATDTTGIPSQRSTYSFEIIPTDLNGDGVINTAIVNGITETTARYNSTFLPRNYTSATEGTRFDQENRFVQLGVRQVLSSYANLQYTFVRTTQELQDNFREYNTFTNGTSDVNHSADYNFNRTEAHTLHGLLTFPTGPISHRVLIGGRYTGDLGRSSTHALRALGPGTERATLDGLIASGRRIRLFLTKNDVL
ncbi:MAG TPA: TonB-dependent receptor plug domain-containing protein, partial [Opitutaceae bacterium]|nr:TonB-dependent receptor plug domain-containing protein [Opitutaceae bacterium]